MPKKLKQVLPIKTRAKPVPPQEQSKGEKRKLPWVVTARERLHRKYPMGMALAYEIKRNETLLSQIQDFLSGFPLHKEIHAEINQLLFREPHFPDRLREETEFLKSELIKLEQAARYEPIESSDVIDYSKETQKADEIVNRLERIIQKVIEGRATGDNRVAENLENELLKTISNEELLAEARRRGLALVASDPSTAPLEHLLAAKNIPPEQYTLAAATITRALDKLGDELRTPWIDKPGKPKPDDLADLSAPEFLKEVWKDKISPDGIVKNDDISDKGLVEAVRAYIKGRKGQRHLGDARGLTIVPSHPGRKKTKDLSMT